MREIVNLNRKWAFSKEATQAPAELPKLWNWVNLPHSWNAIDGQDGGSDYAVKTALENCDKNIPLHIVTIRPDGQIIR